MASYATALSLQTGMHNSSIKKNLKVRSVCNRIVVAYTRLTSGRLTGEAPGSSSTDKLGLVIATPLNAICIPSSKKRATISLT